MKVVQFIGYAPNPGTKKRNQVMYKEVKPEKRKGKGNVPESPLGRGESVGTEIFVTESEVTRNHS